MHALGGNQRERLTQVKTHLTTKHTEGAGAGTVGTLRIRRDGVLVLLEDFAQKIFIGSGDCVRHEGHLLEVRWFKVKQRADQLFSLPQSYDDWCRPKGQNMVIILEFLVLATGFVSL